MEGGVGLVDAQLKANGHEGLWERPPATRFI